MCAPGECREQHASSWLEGRRVPVSSASAGGRRAASYTSKPYDMSTLRPLPPLATAPLFPRLHADLLALLRSLEPADWERPTVAGAWRVRDVAAHLLDGELRTLAAHRDGHALSSDGPAATYADV